MLRSTQLFLLGMLCAFFSHAQITSSFDTDADGWTFFNGSTGASLLPSFSTTGGNPSGGHIFLTFNSSTAVNAQNWIAPSKFLGNQVVRSLGMNLTFDLQQSIASTSSGTTTGSVRIESGGNALVYLFSIAERPGTSWRNYSIKLDETGGWRWNSSTGALATRAQIIGALTNITSLEIRASYAANATYTARLDNVSLGQKTLGLAPNISSFMPTSGVAGTTVTINGSNFGSTPANNAVYFSGREATIVSASPTQITVTVPQAASYGPITVINKATGLLYESLKPFNPTFPDGGRIIPASLAPKSDISLTGVTDHYGLASADIDGDGWMDIIVSENTGTTSVLRNLGAGGNISASSFAPKVSLPGSNATLGIWIEDLDGDGKHDIISAYSNGSQMSYVTFRNISTPANIAFESAELWAALAYSGMLSDVVDVDGDGRLDIIGQHRNGSVSSDFWITQNISSPGQIEFAATTSYFGSSTLDAGDGVGHGDLDNDGKPEMLVVHSFGGQFQILKNNSTPAAISFGTPFVIPEGVNGSPIVADFNLDGFNDIAFKQGFSNDDIIIRINTNAGGPLSAADFATEVILNTADFSNYGGVSIADINGDGKPDLLATDAGNIAVFENVYAGGAFTSASFVPGYVYQGAGNSTYPTTPIASDLNRDGKPDLIMGVTNITPNRISIFQNNNVHTPVISLTTVSPLKGIVGSTVTITGDYFSTVPTENIVKFGGVRATVLTATRNQLTVEVPAGAAYGVVSVTRNELTASYHLPFNVVFSPGRALDATSFGAAVNYTLTGADFDVDVADLNGDNKIDVVAEGTAGSYIFRNDYTTGPITVTTLTRTDTTNTTAQNPRLLDIDDDGKPDIISEQGIYKNISSGSVINFDNLVAIGGTGGTDVGDFNLDGKVDISGVAFGPIEVFENRSRTGAFVTGTFASISTALTFATGGQAVSTAVADFDNDGLKDIAVPVQSSIDYIAFYRNVGQYRLTATTFVSAQNINTLDLPGRIYEGDFDVDGRMDFFLYSQGGGANPNMFSIFHNQSTGPGNVNFVKHDFTIPIVGFACGPSTVSDLDGDGRPDIVITSNSTAAGYVILKNTTTPGTITTTSFTQSALIPLGGPRSVTAADINADGKPDLIFTRAGNLMTIAENLVAGAPVTITTQPSNASICSNQIHVLGAAATGDPSIQYQWQVLTGATFTDVVNDANHAGANTQSLTLTNLAASATYRVRAVGAYAITVSSNAVITVNAAPPAPSVTGNTGCADAAISLSASGGTNGQYRWYNVNTGGSAIAGEVNNTFNTPALASTTTFYVSLNNGTCESPRTAVTASVNVVTPPVVTAGARCGSGTVLLSASGGSATTYRWYDVATGGSVLPSGTDATFTTPTLSANTSYYVSLSDGSCESIRVPVLATINTAPAKPSITSSVTPSANVVTICNGAVTLSAPVGFGYMWSNGATTQQITVSTAGNFSVQITDGNSCTSVSSDALQVVIDASVCNTPPIISTEPLTTSIAGNVSIALSEIITDAENNFNNIIIVSQPTSGATVSISNGIMTIDYSNSQFSGTDRLIVRACDVQNLCSEDVTITIEVVGEIEIFNAVSPNGDGLNEIFRLQYIEVLERTKKNKVTILNRWGDVVFEVANYDNNTRVFNGISNKGTELPSGTYFYKIEFTGANAPAMKTGYLSLKR